MTKEAILETLKLHKKELYQKYGVIKIGVFGSFARGEAKEESDIDIVIEIEKNKKNLHNFLNTRREMEKLLGLRVDLGIESTIKPIVKEYIKKEIIYV